MSVVLTVSTDQIGQRVDSYTAKQLDTSRNYIARLITSKLLKVNGKPVAASYKTKLGDQITIDLPETDTSDELDILFQNEAVIVINKPRGLLSQPKHAVDTEPSVQTMIRDYSRDISDDRGGIVHRLDRQTSGVMVAARTLSARQYLMEQFSNRTVRKYYLAVVRGMTSETKFEIDKPIARNHAKPHAFQVDIAGKPARTLVQLINRNESEDWSSLLVQPHTGRTHQIRVHLASVNLPIIGDQVYGNSSEDHDMMLHAYRLDFALEGGQSKSCVAPIPEDMAQYINDEDARTAITQLNP